MKTNNLNLRDKETIKNLEDFHKSIFSLTNGAGEIFQELTDRISADTDHDWWQEWINIYVDFFKTDEIEFQ